MSIHNIRFPGESTQYRARRDELLEAEMALRLQVEQVAALRRTLPPGGVAENYQFESAVGAVTLSELFGDHDTLIVYSFMFGGTNPDPCPMCRCGASSISPLVGAANSCLNQATDPT